MARLKRTLSGRLDEVLDDLEELRESVLSIQRKIEKLKEQSEERRTAPRRTRRQSRHAR